MPEAIIETPPAPAAPAAPATSAPKELPKGHEDAFGALDALEREEGTPEPPPAPKRAAPPQGPDGKFVKAPVVKPAAAPVTPAPKDDDDVDVDKLPTRDVVKRYHGLRNEKSAWLKEKEDYEKKLKTPQEWPEKKTYEEKLAEREKAIEDYNKRLAAQETELQFTNFTKSQAYKDQYEKPYFASWKAGQSRTASMKVIERKDASDAVLQQSRQGTAKDFHQISCII